MKILGIVLANLLRSGKVTVEVPGLDMNKLIAELHDPFYEAIQDIAWSVYEGEESDAEKLKYIQEVLERVL